MNESELQKKVDRDALIVGAKKAIKRAEQKKFGPQSKQPKLVKAFDKRTGKERFVLQSDIMRNPSGFTPVSGSIADMLRTSDRKKEERRIRKGRDRDLRIERLKQFGQSRIKPRPGKTKAFKIGGAMLKNPGKADLDKDGQLSSYEKKRGMAIEKAMAGKPQKALLGKLFRKKSGKATPGVMMIEGSPGGMGGLLKKLLKGKKFSKGGGKDMGSRQAEIDKVNKIMKRKVPPINRLTPEQLKEINKKFNFDKPRTMKPLAKKMGGGLTEATNRLRAQGKMGGGMMNTMGYKKGKSVMAKGCKIGRKKPTKLY